MADEQLVALEPALDDEDPEATGEDDGGQSAQRGPYPRRGLLGTLRDLYLRGVIWAVGYLGSIAPNAQTLWKIITQQTPTPWHSFGELLHTIVLLIVPAALLNPLYIVPTLLGVVVLAWLYRAAKNDQISEQRFKERRVEAEKSRQLRQVETALDQKNQHRIQDLEARLLTPGAAGNASPVPSSTITRPPADDAFLPETPAALVGRQEEVAWLAARLYPKTYRNAVALYGPTGSGKTAIAAAAIRQARERFPEGIAVIDCAGATDAVPILRAILTRFSPYVAWSAWRLRDRPSALPSLMAKLLLGNNVLVVLENVALGGEQLRDVLGPLLAAQAAVVLLAREPAEGLEALIPVGAYRVLGPLPEAEARGIFAREYARAHQQRGGGQVGADVATAVGPTVEAVGRWPLALQMAAAYAVEARVPLARLAADWKANTLPEDQSADDAEGAVRRMVTRCLDALPAEAQRVFAALAAFPTRAFSHTAASALAAHVLASAAGGANDASASSQSGAGGAGERSLDLLLRLGLLDTAPAPEGAQASLAGQSDQSSSPSLPAQPPSADDRVLVLQPLVGDLAAERWAKLPAAERDSLRVWLAHYYGSMFDAAVASGNVPATGPDGENLGALVEWAARARRHALYVTLCFQARGFWRDRGRLESSLRHLATARALTEPGQRRLLFFRRRPAVRADARTRFGLIYYYAEAVHDQVLAMTPSKARDAEIIRVQTLYKQSERAAHAAREKNSLAHCYGAFGKLAMERKDAARASSYFKNALDMYRQAPRDYSNEGSALIALGDVAALRRGDFDKATDADLAEADGYYREALLAFSHTPDLEKPALANLRLGDLAQRRRDSREARKAYMRAYEMYRRLGDVPNQVFAMQLRLQVDQPAGVPETIEDLVKYCRDRKDRRGEAMAQAMLGNMYAAKNNLPRAREALMLAIELCRAVWNREGEADALQALGNVELNRGQTDRAERLFEQAAAIYRDRQLWLGEQFVGIMLGHILMRRGDVDGAERYFLRARAVFASDKDHPRTRHAEAVALLPLSGVAQRRGRLDEAHSLAQEAADIWAAYGNVDGSAGALFTLGDIEQQRSRLAAAWAYFDQAQTLNAQVGNQLSEMAALQAKGNIAQLRGELDEAEKIFLKAQQFFREQDAPEGVGAATLSLAALYWERGQLAEAEGELERAHSMLGGTEHQLGATAALANSGLVAQSQGRFDEAARCFREGLEHFRKIQDRMREGEILGLQGRLDLLRGRPEAGARLREAAEICRETQDPRHEALALVALGEMEQEHQHPDRARALYEHGLRLARQTEFRRHEGYTLSLIGRLDAQEGKLAEAERALDQALALLETAQDRPDYAVALARRAQVYAGRGDQAAAEEGFRKALALAERLPDPLHRPGILLSYGRYLIETAGERQQGIELVRRAEREATHIGLPLAERARDLLRQLSA